MKKILIALMTLILCLACCAGAESAFTLRGGIQMGDPMSTVAEKESWTRIDGWHIYRYAGKLTGRDSMVVYANEENGDLSFSDNSPINRVLYTVGTVYAEDGTTRYSSESNFAALLNALLSKYGSPAVPGVDPMPVDPRLESYVANLASNAAAGKTDFESLSPSSKSQAVWVLRQDKEAMVIDRREYSVRQQGEDRYYLMLEYRGMTTAELNAVISSMADL